MRVREAISTFRGHRVPNLRIIPRRNWWFALSGLFIVLSLVGLIFVGLTFSIDFRGGAQLSYPNRTGATVTQISGTLEKYGRAKDSVVEIVSGSGQCGNSTGVARCVNIRTESLTTLGSRGTTLRAELARQAGIDANLINEQDVGATWGGTITSKAVQGLIIFLILVTLYISMRFEWKMAISALVALAHDLIITAGIYALVGRQVTPASVIAILTILGYSLYDTVVIFDKIKENTTDSPAMVARETYSGMANISLNQTLMRSVNTSLVVLLPIGSLLLFGGQTLKDFAFALFVGVASGTYSSIFVAAPILALLKEREPRFQQIRQRAAVRSTKPGLKAASASGRVPVSVGRRGQTNGEGDLPDGGVTPAAQAARAGTRTGGGTASSGSAARSGSRPPSGARKKSKPKPKRRRR